MPVGAPPAPAFDKGRTAGGSGALKWVKTHQTEAIGIGGAAAVGAYALAKRKSAGSSSTSDTSTGGTSGGTDPTGTYSSGSVDQYNALAGAISSLGDSLDEEQTLTEKLQAQIAKLEQKTPTKGKPPVKKKPKPLKKAPPQKKAPKGTKVHKIRNTPGDKL